MKVVPLIPARMAISRKTDDSKLPVGEVVEK